MRRALGKITRYLLVGLALNLAVAWGLMALHGPPSWNGVQAYHNPRAGDPIAFYAVHAPGLEWVVGCGRPGTLVSRHPESVHVYPGDPWWPPEAVTFSDGPCGAAAGWPLLSFSCWRTLRTTELPGNQGLIFTPVHHWGFLLAEAPESRKDDWGQMPAMLPLRPIWPGFAANTLLYALTAACAAWGLTSLRRRLRLAKGLCPWCAYPLDPGRGERLCPECGRRARPLEVLKERGKASASLHEPSLCWLSLCLCGEDSALRRAHSAKDRTRIGSASSRSRF